MSDNRSNNPDRSAAAEPRLSPTHRAIVTAAEHPLQGSGDLQAYARLLTRLVCDTLHVRHAGIWMLAEDGAGLSQLSVHDSLTGGDSEGLTLSARDYPVYFRALMSGRAIDAADARQDPRTREFREGYLEPLGIHAMLDAAIRVDGRIVGIVCCEHTGAPRAWLADEVSFAAEIADQMAQAIITRDKLEAIRQLQRERGSIRARTDFLARLSHEIRTPMNGVLGMTELLRLTPVSPRQREYLDVIEQSGQLLLHLVNDILEYAKLESGKLSVRPRPFDPRALLDSLQVQFRDRAAAAGLSLQVMADTSLPGEILQDPERVLQILVNLVGNALKFTPQGGIRVTACRADDEPAAWQVRVRDTGIGLDPELRERLFEPFEQGEAAGQHGKGTGLGLAISRSLAELMGGRLEAEDSSGPGTTFILTLPLADAATADSPAPATIAPETSPATTMRVLVAEDNEINRRVMAGMLERYFGVRAENCANGRETLDRLAAGESFDVIFMDCEMPVMDGLEATRRIRDLPGAAARTPIAAISAHNEEDMRETAYAAGVDYYISKPFGREALGRVLRQVRDAAGRKPG